MTTPATNHGVQCPVCGEPDQHELQACDMCGSIDHVRCEECDNTGLIEVCINGNPDRCETRVCDCAHGDNRRAEERRYGRD